jgi:hypothetical protein
MDIYELQRNDHDKFLHLLSILENHQGLKESEVEEIAEELRLEVLSHAMAEEETFFAEIEDRVISLKEDVEQTHQMHEELESLLDKLIKLKTNEQEWIPTISAIRELLEADIIKEDQKFYTVAKSIFNEGQAVEIATKMTVRKRELATSIGSRLKHKMMEHLEGIAEAPKKIIEKIQEKVF